MPMDKLTKKISPGQEKIRSYSPESLFLLQKFYI